MHPALPHTATPAPPALVPEPTRAPEPTPPHIFIHTCSTNTGSGAFT